MPLVIALFLRAFLIACFLAFNAILRIVLMLCICGLFIDQSLHIKCSESITIVGVLYNGIQAAFIPFGLLWSYRA